MNHKLSSLFNEFDEIAIFDIETTGLDYRNDQIIDFGLVAFQEDSDNEFFAINELIQLSPGKVLPQNIVNLTGITSKMLEGGILTHELFDRLYRYFKTPSKKLLVAYNAQFDLSFLFQFLKRYNATNILDDISFLDPMTIFRDRASYPHRLSDAINFYHLNDVSENSHRAFDDAKATYEVLKAMAEEKDDIKQYINLFGYNPRYGVSYEKITKIKYLPQSYDRRGKLYQNL